MPSLSGSSGGPDHAARGAVEGEAPVRVGEPVHADPPGLVRISGGGRFV